jgi:hypothetical protein
MFYTGCGGTLINEKFITKLKTKKVTNTEWTTKAGSFETKRMVNCTFTLPEFHEVHDITWTMYVDETDTQLSRDAMIIGQDLLEELRMDFLFSEGLISWDNATVPMHNPDWPNATHIDELENGIS